MEHGLTTLQLQTLKLFCIDRRYFVRYSTIVNFDDAILQVIADQITILYQHNSENCIEKNNLISVIRLLKLDDVYLQAIESIYSADTQTDGIEAILHRVHNRYLLYQLSNDINEKIQTSAFDSLDSIQELLVNEIDDPAEDNKVISLELTGYESNPGYNWPLRKIQERLGPLPEQTHGLIYAPVEAGKTAMVSNCSLFFRQQGAKVLHLNNEDPKQKVLERYYINFFRLPISVIREDLRKYSALFSAAHSGRLIIIDDAALTAFQVDYLVRQHKPDVVFIDQSDHLARDGEAATLEALYYKLRQVAKRRNTRVISVTQASRSDGPYLGISDLHNSKVGKQGQLDWMMGIFPPANYPGFRNISFPKNKLTGNHRSCVIKFDPILLRYED